jgi:hypothetical protein
LVKSKINVSRFRRSRSSRYLRRPLLLAGLPPGRFRIMAAMSAGDCESMSPIRVIPLSTVGTALCGGADDAGLRPVGFLALAATFSAGGVCPSPSPYRIMPLLCNRPIIGGGATGPIAVRVGLLVVFLLATSVALLHYGPSRKRWELPVVGRVLGRLAGWQVRR